MIILHDKVCIMQGKHVASQKKIRDAFQLSRLRYFLCIFSTHFFISMGEFRFRFSFFFCRSLFDNVLEAVGTAASVEVIKDRILSGDAPREKISSWINSLTFIPKPDLELMGAAYPLIRARDNNPNILLSYSSLAHAFCRHHPDCSRYKPVQILSSLYDKFFNLTGCVTKQRKNVDQASSIFFAINIQNGRFTLKNFIFSPSLNANVRTHRYWCISKELVTLESLTAGFTPPSKLVLSLMIGVKFALRLLMHTGNFQWRINVNWK